MTIWLAALESDSCFVGDSAARILSGGAGKSFRLWRVFGIPAQDHSRGHNARRLHRIRDHVSEGEICVEPSRSFYVSVRCRVLRFCVQVSRTVRMNNCRLETRTEPKREIS